MVKCIGFILSLELHRRLTNPKAIRLVTSILNGQAHFFDNELRAMAQSETRNKPQSTLNGAAAKLLQCGARNF